MNEKEPDWRTDDDEDLKALIRATIKSAGSTDPAALPSKLRERIKSRLAGDTDLESYIKDALKDQRKT
ncbi:MAG: hypothetical protein AAFW68_07690 [Pseudomonadota bacterium]